MKYNLMSDPESGQLVFLSPVWSRSKVQIEIRSQYDGFLKIKATAASCFVYLKNRYNVLFSKRKKQLSLR